MAVEIGDMVVANGRVGDVLDLDAVTGMAVVRPYPQPGQEALPAGSSFTAEGEVRVLKKHFERARQQGHDRDRGR